MNKTAVCIQCFDSALKRIAFGERCDNIIRNCVYRFMKDKVKNIESCRYDGETLVKIAEGENVGGGLQHRGKLGRKKPGDTHIATEVFFGIERLEEVLPFLKGTRHRFPIEGLIGGDMNADERIVRGVYGCPRRLCKAARSGGNVQAAVDDGMADVGVRLLVIACEEGRVALSTRRAGQKSAFVNGNAVLH